MIRIKSGERFLQRAAGWCKVAEALHDYSSVSSMLNVRVSNVRFSTVKKKRIRMVPDTAEGLVSQQMKW